MSKTSATVSVHIIHKLACGFSSAPSGSSRQPFPSCSASSDNSKANPTVINKSGACLIQAEIGGLGGHAPGLFAQPRRTRLARCRRQPPPQRARGPACAGRPAGRQRNHWRTWKTSTSFPSSACMPEGCSVNTRCQTCKTPSRYFVACPCQSQSGSTQAATACCGTCREGRQVETHPRLLMQGPGSGRLCPPVGLPGAPLLPAGRTKRA